MALSRRLSGISLLPRFLSIRVFRRVVVLSNASLGLLKRTGAPGVLQCRGHRNFLKGSEEPGDLRDGNPPEAEANVKLLYSQCLIFLKKIKI